MTGSTTDRQAAAASARGGQDAFLDGELEALVGAAIRAPSGDNTQPWRFAIDRVRGEIALAVDERRDTSPMNAGQRMARIACGAALENLVQAARARGLSALIDIGDDGAATARLRREGLCAAPPTATQAVRATNRRRYDGRRLPPDQAVALAAATAPADGIATHWITDRARLPAIADLVARADALMFSRPRMREAFFGQVRFDAPRAEPTPWGLPLGSLEISSWQARGMRLLRALPQGLFVASGGAGVFARQARALVRSASGVCVIAASGHDAVADVTVGRAAQRAWLALTRLGACAQPMMSLPVIANLLEHGPPAEVIELGPGRARALAAAVAVAVPELGAGRAAFILRFGFAPAPTARTGRRPLSEALVAGRDGAGG